MTQVGAGCFLAHDVFISYSQSDKAAADAVCHRLEAAGLRCWIAPRDVGYGKSWDDAVVDAITAAKLMIVMFSVAANASRHVLNEVATALDVGATVIPFRIEDTRPTGALHLHLGRLHWLDALSPPLEGHIDRLIDNARQNLAARAGDEPALPLEPPAEPPLQVEASPPPLQTDVAPTGRHRRLAVIGLLAVAAAAVAILALSLNGTFTAPSKVPGDQQAARAATAPPAAPVAEAKPAPTATPIGADRPSRPGETFQDCARCPEMVVLAAGRFLMGADSDEHARYAVPKERAEREAPRHAVTLERPFAFGKFAVTRAEYADFVGETGYDSPMICNAWDGSKWVPQAGRNWRQPGLPQTDRDPVLCVNGDDIDAYLRWLRQKTGRAYRLPSEAEWEYAARGGTTTAFYWGNEWTDACRFENVGDQSIQQAKGWTEANPCRDGYVYTAPVGSFQPNPFGLYDMLGNARARVADCVNQTYTGAPSDGSGWTSGDCTRRIVRGGNWSLGVAFWVRSANRIFDTYNNRNNQAGFRVALPLP